ncbi:DUF1758 domain-containing protein [Trichonephila clavipes]|nr:DUF1758 domain-containing protein [Trichonephila clavipes]
MKNAVSGRTKTDLSTLYDELEGKLRSLESLGRTQEKYRDFLTPLVESCLPEEILMSWEIKRNTETDAKGSRTLEHLMTFLRLEVQGKRWCSWQNPVLELLSKKEILQLKGSGKERVRVLIDTACESSYISESVTSILKATPLREEAIIHSLFGGNETKPKHHSVYSIEVSDLKHSYACCFEVLSEKKICGFISKIEDKRILNELKNKEIILSDLNCKETEIGLLIGADNIGKLLTGNLIEFDSGLTAIETKLGWTVIGKVCSNDKNVMLTTSSLHVRNVSIKELWELDVLGITDPLLNENKKENFELTDFKNKMKIRPDGRYEVKLPWKCNSENLPSNKELTWKRHIRMMNKLRNVYRHCRVVFGVSSSPYLLNASIMHLLENCNSECKEVAQKLKSSFYVDNCVTGVFSADEIEIFIEKTKLFMSEGCFNLRIFESNVASKSVDKRSGETFIFGIIWDLDNDVLKCCTNFDSLTCEVKITKRLVLSTVQKVFDPIGMLAQSTLLPKLLLQEIWKMKKAWDQELPQNIVNKFIKWFNEIQILKDVTVPRCMKIDIFTELHVFVDASKGSYAGCVFARSIVDSRVSVILVRAKSRVAPLKLLSIPRLVLMACCVGARLVNSILKALNMPDLKVTLWSDSTTALWWIKEYENWSVFVANRVKEIRQLKFSHGMKSLSSGPSPLPPDRVNDCGIFEVVGIDLAGPLFLKTGEKELIPLTPAMFLIENRCSDTTDIDELNSRDLRKRE